MTKPALYILETMMERKTIENTEGEIDYKYSCFGESDFPVLVERTTDIGDLYHMLQRQYGRCAGHVRVDREGGDIPIGWVFEKRATYEDDRNKTYLQETWVSVLYRLHPDGTPYTEDDLDNESRHTLTRQWVSEGSEYRLPTFRSVNVQKEKTHA